MGRIVLLVRPAPYFDSTQKGFASILVNVCQLLEQGFQWLRNRISTIQILYHPSVLLFEASFGKSSDHNS